MLNELKKIIKKNNKIYVRLKLILLYVRYIRAITKTDKYKNTKIINALNVFQIKEKGYHCYFGYYDKSPMNPSETYVAYLKIKEGDKDKADICIYDLKTQTPTIIAKTITWNWQQGCMLQWINDYELSYNNYENGKYVSTIYNIVTNNIKQNTHSVYAYNSDFTKYLSLNFYRLDLFAKGYGYSQKIGSLELDEDGVWECEVGGESKLLISLKQIINYNAHFKQGVQHYVNHVTYCPNENYIMFIHRWQEQGVAFTSRLLLYDKINDKLITILDNGHVSHYCWFSEQELMIYATNNEGFKGYFIINIYNGKTKILKGLPHEDGHPTYSIDKNLILTDTYPNNLRIQHLFIYDVKKEELLLLDKLKSPFRYYNEERCDLHPRWSMTNKYIMVDNTATGLRSIRIYKIK